MDAVIHFNCGHAGSLNVLHYLGIIPGNYCVTAIHKLDAKRVADSKRSFKNVNKKAKNKDIDTEDDDYGAGLF